MYLDWPAVHVDSQNPDKESPNSCGSLGQTVTHSLVGVSCLNYKDESQADLHRRSWVSAKYGAIQELTQVKFSV